jgi:uncharacterized RDD family membrane protein YckC
VEPGVAVESAPDMDRAVSVRTPESIAFRYELAGLGSRCLAVVIDLIIQFALFALIIWGLIAIGGDSSNAVSRNSDDSFTRAIAIAIIVFIIFTIFYGYFILFEAFWGGQTPGKKLLGLRVVRDGGYPLDFGGAFLRNLIRIAEQILGFYVLSAISSLASPENKRLGDYAAGTIVVREGRLNKPLTLADAIASGERKHSGAYLTDDERAMVDRFLARRAGLDPYKRRQIALALADRFRDRAPANAPRDDEGLLETL